MKRTNAQSVGDIIRHYLQSEHLDGKMNELRVAELWSEVVGMGVNRYTVNRYVKNGVLHVRISSAPLRHELMLVRTSLIQRLNDAVGTQVIHDIAFS